MEPLAAAERASWRTLVGRRSVKAVMEPLAVAERASWRTLVGRRSVKEKILATTNWNSSSIPSTSWSVRAPEAVVVLVATRWMEPRPSSRAVTRRASGPPLAAGV
ncbi:Os04g0664300 [Oryza sativa Japonica Group]|uniref:Os04g0664300 protein n=2 Tax=Oryza sativa subsp. japonica TaxID=39947 RepID=Q0J9A5_ORYSJ|nr:Os04g0664300 [Oryza sativa Japonica Group]BAS91488.1 Os04g0664300 [Oryza sativa Japonica Group]|eukprot:NP_001054168.1 Os04g0664300 [Oryza sativa Japonica Group]